MAEAGQAYIQLKFSIPEVVLQLLRYAARACIFRTQFDLPPTYIKVTPALRGQLLFLRALQLLLEICQQVRCRREEQLLPAFVSPDRSSWKNLILATLKLAQHRAQASSMQAATIFALRWSRSERPDDLEDLTHALHSRSPGWELLGSQLYVCSALYVVLSGQAALQCCQVSRIPLR